MKPVSKTAYYTAGVRMLDAKKRKPICGDTLAQVFMNEQGMEVLQKTQHIASARITAVQRHQIIDMVLQEILQQNAKTKIFIVGAGFDTRAYRMKGGNWFEVDEPEVINQKDTILTAATASNPLQRIAIEFATEKITDKLQAFQTDEKVVIVLEGVSMYLTDAQFTDTLQQLEQLFPNHTLVCDLLTRQFFKRYSYRLHKRLNDFGAVFNFQHTDPQAFILKHNYTLQKKISVIATGIQQGNLRIPKLLQWLFKKDIQEGYTINVFGKG
jgi:methyltransferase (TIGR00027 family)